MADPKREASLLRVPYPLPLLSLISLMWGGNTEFRASGRIEAPQFSASGEEVEDAGASALAHTEIRAVITHADVPLLTEFRASGDGGQLFRASPDVQEPAPRIWRKSALVIFGALCGAVMATCLLAFVVARTWRSSSSPPPPPPPPPHPTPPPPPLMNRTWTDVAMSKDGSKVFATEYGGMIYSSLDFGSSWTGNAATCCLNWMSIAASADGRVLIANADNIHQSLFVSGDAGLTWAATNTSSGRKHVAASGDGYTLAAADEDGVISISLDSGGSWQAAQPPGVQVDWRALAVSHGGELIIVGGQGPTYTSSSRGATWLLTTGISQCWGFASSDDGRELFASCAPPDETWVLLTSVDAGLSWQSRQSLSGMAYGAAIASSASGSSLVASWSGQFEVSGAGAVNVSTNGGLSWATRFLWPYTGRGGSSVAMSSDGCTIALACFSGLLYVTADCGLTWRAVL